MAAVLDLKALRRNLEHLDRDRGYRFRNQDPVMAQVNRAITDSSLALSVIAQRSGVTVGTLRRWQLGSVRRPQNITVEAVFQALGYRRIIIGPNGVELL